MATYSAVTARARALSGKSIKTCWIAHVLTMSGKQMRRAPNRISDSTRVHPCPNDERRKAIITALSELGMLGPHPVPVG